MSIQPVESWPVQVYTLGRFEIVIDGVPLRFVTKTPRKVLAVLKGLICAGRRGVRPSTLHDALWPESDSMLARRALNTSIYRLRHLLRRKDAIALNDAGISLDPAVCWVDAWAFEQGLAERIDPTGVRSVLRLYGGMFLSDSDHPLAYEVRERLRRKFVQAVLRLGQAHERGGELTAAVALYESALEMDCTSEDVHCALMRCHAKEGKSAAVGAAYQRCRTMLWRHYATRPSPVTEHIYRAACGNLPAAVVPRMMLVRG